MVARPEPSGMSIKSLRTVLTWLIFAAASGVVFFLGIIQGLNPNWNTTYYVYDEQTAAARRTPPALPLRRWGGGEGRATRPSDAPLVVGNKVRELRSKSVGTGFTSNDGPSEWLSWDYIYNKAERRHQPFPGIINATGQSTDPTKNGSKTKITRSIRNHTMQSICSAEQVNDIGMLEPGARETLARQIIVDDKRKFLYCYVPKVACSNWKRVIKFMQGTIGDIGAKFKMDHKNGLVFLDSFSEEEKLFRIKNYYKFMFVRNPTERLLSAYRNKFGEEAISQYKERYAEKIIRRYRGSWDGKSKNITLEEFIRFVLDTRTTSMDQHWKPMYLLCQPCAVQYDFVGSFEQLNEDADYVLEKIKGNTGAYFPPRQEWYHPTTVDKIQSLIKEVDPVYIQQFVDKYILDFITFGYAPPKQYYLKYNQPDEKEGGLMDNEIDNENDIDPRGSERS